MCGHVYVPALSHSLCSSLSRSLDVCTCVCVCVAPSLNLTDGDCCVRVCLCVVVVCMCVCVFVRNLARKPSHRQNMHTYIHMYMYFFVFFYCCFFLVLNFFLSLLLSFAFCLLKSSDLFWNSLSTFRLVVSLSLFLSVFFFLVLFGCSCWSLSINNFWHTKTKR